MFHLRRWIRKYVYGLVIEEETIVSSSIDWHPVSKCKFCQKPLMVECQFCPHCGYNLATRQTTGTVKLVEPLIPLIEPRGPVIPLMVPDTSTGILRKYQLPGERAIKTLGRVRKKV